MGRERISEEREEMGVLRGLLRVEVDVFVGAMPTAEVPLSTTIPISVHAEASRCNKAHG